MFILKPIVATAITLFLLSRLLPTVSYGDWTTLLLASVVLTFLQKIVRPILGILFLPINLVTMGLFSLVLNVGMLWLAQFLVPGFSISAMSVFGVELNQFFSLLVVSFFLSLVYSLVRIVL